MLLNTVEIYTAVGNVLGTQEGKLVLQVGNRELMVDPQEGLVWLFLNWSIYPKESIVKYAEAQYPQLGQQRSYEECLNRMVQRGLLAKGCSDNPFDAFYRLFADLYIQPMFIKKQHRLRAAFKLLTMHYPLKTAMVMARPLVLEDIDKAILRLIEQNKLSTAEIVSYMEKTIPKPQGGLTGDDVLDIIYDGELGSEALVFKSEHSIQRMPVVTSLLRLYEQRAIKFDGQ